jgi:hypothetical protein
MNPTNTPKVIWKVTVKLTGNWASLGITSGDFEVSAADASEAAARALELAGNGVIESVAGPFLNGNSNR